MAIYPKVANTAGSLQLNSLDYAKLANYTKKS
jgi:hypothetical protein